MKNILRNSNFGFTKWFIALTVALFALSVATHAAPVSITASGTYTQDFNGLISTGTGTWTDDSTIAAWYAQRTGTGTSIAADTGSLNGGNLYSFGSTSSSDRALGSLGSSNAAAGQFAWGMQFQNTSASTVTIGTVSYTGEEWRKGGNTTASVVTFWYKVSSSAITSLNPSTEATDDTTTGWTAVTALNFSSPVNTSTGAALDGNATANKVAISANANISVPAGSYVMLRWKHPRPASGSSHGLAIDDVSVAYTVPTGGTGPTISGFSPSSGAVGSSVTISGSNFSSPTVKFNGTTATVTASSATSITATVPSGATTGKITVEVAGQTTATSGTDFTVTAASAPFVTVSPVSATGLTNYVGQASAPTNYTVTGTNLVSNLVVTASTNAIEVSTNSSTGFTNSFSLAPSGSGTLSNTVYVRISALAPAGAVSATVGNVSGLASNNFTVSGTVTQPALTLVLATNSVAENAGANATTGTVGIPAILGTDLVVNLVSTNTTAATVPSTVTITNGQTNATFAIAAVASSGSFQPQTTAIEASNSNYTTASATLTVTNVDVPIAPLAAKGWINEFHYDNTGADAGEFVEIVLADTTPTTNVSVILYNGGTAGSFIPYGTASDLASFTKGVSANGYTIYSKSFPVDGIQNGGTDGIALIIDNVVEEFISYEGSAVATSGAAAGYTSKDIGISEEPPGAAGGSLYRYGPGSVGRDFAWAKATVATPGQVNAGQNLGATGVQGTGTLAIANTTASSPFLTQNIFPKATAGQTVSLTLTGTLSSGTISAMSVAVPAALTGLSADNVTVSGTGAGTAVKTLSGSTLTITGLVVDQLNPVTINIAGLTTPETAGDLTKDGNYPFTVQTGVDGNLQSLLIQPIAVVTIPIANLGDVDANGVSLDVGKTVAVQGVCTEENFNSTSSTSAYLQSGQPDGVLKAGINIYSGQRNLFVRGDEYVVTGSVLNYNGLTELVVAASSQVVRLGTASAVPTPVTLTIAELTAAHEAYEGSLVRVVGLSKVSGTWALTVVGTVTSGSNIILANAGVNLTARLNVGSTALTEPIYPTAITGIYGQFVATSPYTGGGQIQPRDQADIQDAPGLRLAFAEAYLYESINNPPLGGTPVSGALTVSRTGADTSAALVVALSASPTGVVQFPASVTIPAGQESASVTVEAIDNSAFDAAGSTNVTLTGSALGSGLSNGSATIMILEDEASAPADTIKPVITLIGANPQLVANGGVYTDLKATVTDNVDASREITGTGTVNTAVAGDYTITYNASDAAGNAAIAVTRTVRVAAPLGTTYSGWLGQAGASDAAFLDYVFGAVTPGTLDPNLRPTVAVTGGNLVLTYNVRQGTTGLTVTPKMSADLAAGPSGWVTTDVTVANVGAPREVNGVSVQQKTASVPVSGAKKFLRVEAVQQ